MAWLLGDRLSRIALGLAVNMMLARSLGPGECGRLSYAMALAAMVLPIGTLGLERIAVRELAAGRALAGEVLGTVGLLRLVGGLVGWLVAIMVAWITSGHGESNVVLVTLIVAGNVFLSSDVIDWVFQARGDFRRGTKARLGAFVICAIAKLYAAANGAGPVCIGVLVLAEAVVSAALLTVALRRDRISQTARYDSVLAKNLVLASSPLLIAEIAVWVFQRADVMILEAWTDTAAIGVYSVAQRLAQAGFFVPGLVVQALSPVIARMKGPAEALCLVQRTMSGLTLVAYGLAAALAMGAQPMVSGLFGASFKPAAGVLVVLAWSNVFVFMGCVHSLYLVNHGMQALSLRLAWLTATVSVALNLLLVPRHGAMGAAIANLSTYGFTTVFGVAMYRDSRPLLIVNLRALVSPILVPLELVRVWRRTQ